MKKWTDYLAQNGCRSKTSYIGINETAYKQIQADALRHAAQLAEKVGEHLRQDDPRTGEPRDSTPEMAEGAFMAASRICMESDNVAEMPNIRS